MSIDEREWQAQEQALRDSRAGAPATAADPLRTGYRRIADALRTAPVPDLPADFAASVARLAARQSAMPVDTRLEGVLTATMVLVLAGAGLVCAFVYGRDWLSPLSGLLPAAPSMPLRLAVAVAVCAALSWGFDAVRERRPQR